MNTIPTQVDRILKEDFEAVMCTKSFGDVKAGKIEGYLTEIIEDETVTKYGYKISAVWIDTKYPNDDEVEWELYTFDYEKI